MTNFNPAEKKEEVFVTMQVTEREAHLLEILRTINFGKVTVQKMNNILIRLETSKSILLDENIEWKVVNNK